MNDIIEIHNNYRGLGIENRKITQGPEFDLVREYIDHRKYIFKATDTKKLAIFIEPKIGSAYPDIVFVEYNPDNYLDWNSYRKSLAVPDYKILYHVFASRYIGTETLVEQLGITWKTAALSLERLYDSKLITRENAMWKLCSTQSIMCLNIEAVEAKLNHWNEVLQQSIINRNFASESYALSERETCIQDDLMIKFKQTGVGVYLKRGKSFARVKKAKHSAIPVSFNSIVLNEWVGRIITA